MRKTKPLSNPKIKLKIQFKQNQFYHHLKKKIYQQILVEKKFRPLKI